MPETLIDLCSADSGIMFSTTEPAFGIQLTGSRFVSPICNAWGTRLVALTYGTTLLYPAPNMNTFSRISHEGNELALLATHAFSLKQACHRTESGSQSCGILDFEGQAALSPCSLFGPYRKIFLWFPSGLAQNYDVLDPVPWTTGWFPWSPFCKIIEITAFFYHSPCRDSGPRVLPHWFLRRHSSSFFLSFTFTFCVAGVFSLAIPSSSVAYRIFICLKSVNVIHFFPPCIGNEGRRCDNTSHDDIWWPDIIPQNRNLCFSVVASKPPCRFMLMRWTIITRFLSISK